MAVAIGIIFSTTIAFTMGITISIPKQCLMFIAATINFVDATSIITVANLFFAEAKAITVAVIADVLSLDFVWWVKKFYNFSGYLESSDLLVPVEFFHRFAIIE